jgi:hypothetical protein
VTKEPAFALFPDSTWLVLRATSSLFEESPFAGAQGCEDVAPPDYLYFSAGEAKGKPDEVAFYLATTSASRAFRECIVKMVLAHGGKADAPVAGLYSTPSGQLAVQEETLLFTTDSAVSKELTALISSQAKGQKAPRLQLLHQLSPRQDGALLSASLILSPAWLDAVTHSLGASPSDSPLVGLKGARFDVSQERVGRGELRCDVEKCERLARFAHSAVNDLIETLPAALAPKLRSSIGVRYPVAGRPDVVELSLEPAGLSLILALLRYASGSDPSPKR